jgi:HlyD family secretion protein/adhesin transport system membrane fusion protein
MTSPSSTQVVVAHSPLIDVRNTLPTLTQSLHLEEGKPPRGTQSTIFIITLIVASFIGWSALTPVQEVALTTGQVIPTGFIKTVQHLEGGIISELLVNEGDVVQKGQLLIKLDGAIAQSELDQAKIKETALKIEAERLRAFGMGQQPHFDAFESIAKNLVDDQKAIYDMQVRNRDDQRSVIDKQIEQQKALLAIQLGQERDLQEQLEVVKQQRDVNKELFEKRLKTGSEYRKSEEDLSKVRKELNSVMNQTQQTRQSIAEAESRLLELDTRLREEALRKLGEITSEKAQLEEALTKLQDRVNRLEIRAPTDGVVKGLKVTTLNGIIQPGAEIMQIVPKDMLEVEVQVDPKDIGNVVVGQRVLVKVSAYEYARYGGIEGKLKAISGSTFVDEKNNNKPFYRAYVTLNQLYVGTDPSINQISPGMTVQADIFTGEKSLLDYFINPVYKAITTSFRER